MAATSGSSSPWTASGPLSAISRSTSARNSAGHRGPQVQVGERRAQVEAGPADDDRPAPFGQELVDLGVRQGREAPRAELPRHLDEADQPVLEP